MILISFCIRMHLPAFRKYIMVHLLYELMRFLGVDYTRRLVIDAAKQQGHRLMLEPKMLEQTGLSSTHPQKSSTSWVTPKGHIYINH